MKPFHVVDNVEIYHGNNADILPSFSSGMFDLVLTSPPYDDIRKYGGYSWDFDAVATELVRVLKDGGVIVWIVADKTANGSETGSSFRQALQFMELGLLLNDTMIYERYGPPSNVKNRYQHSFEYMFVLSKGTPNTFNPIMRDVVYPCDRKLTSYGRDSDGEFNVGAQGKYSKAKDDPDFLELTNDTPANRRQRPLNNIWRYAVGGGHMGDAICRNHPAVFPESLARDHIISWTNDGDLVLDPFLGSGTTAAVARAEARVCVGIELNENYCDLAVNRLSQKVLF